MRELATRGGIVQEKAEYVSRPTLGDLLSKDVMVYAIVSGTVMIWAVYFVVVSLVKDSSSGGESLSNDTILIIFLLITVADIGILGWRARYLSTFASRGVETPARIARLTKMGDQIAVEYDYSFGADRLSGKIGVGGVSPQKKAEALVGREIFILIDPDKPTRSLVISKLK
jgi:hypothetical protein